MCFKGLKVSRVPIFQSSHGRTSFQGRRVTEKVNIDAAYAVINESAHKNLIVAIGIATCNNGVRQVL